MSKDVEWDLSAFERASRDLEKLSKRALPIASRNALNRSAFAGRKVWQDEVNKTFVTRNTYTARTIAIEKATINAGNPSAMVAVIGSRAEYMGRREAAAVESSRGGRQPIPTRAAAGQGGTGKRTKLVRGRNKMKSINLWKGRPRYGSKKQRNAINIAHAHRSNSAANKYALLDTRHGNVIAKVSGRRNAKVKILWDVSRASVKVDAKPTLQPTLTRMEKRMPRIVVDEIKKQIVRERLFRSR